MAKGLIAERLVLMRLCTKERQRREILKPGASAEQSEARRPWIYMHEQARPERPKYHGHYALSALDQRVCLLPGATRSASLRACPWLSHSAPLALRFHFLSSCFAPCVKLLSLISSRFLLEILP